MPSSVHRSTTFWVSNDIANRPAGPLSVADLPDVAQDRIRRFQAAAQARNTSAAYGTQLALFKRWCAQHGYSDAPPVAPVVVAAWTERAAAGQQPIDA